jgi:hypothetical protein
MKIILLSICLGLAFLQQGHGQSGSISCDSLRIDSVWLIQAGINRIAVRLHFLGSSTDFISYPYFPFIFNQFGDTIAKGGMEFFGQLGGTKQEYLNITFLNELPPVMYLRLRFNSDSCSFPWFLASSGMHQAAAKPTFFPNPADDKVYLRTVDEKEIQFTIADSLGRIVKTGKATNEIPISEFPAGLYLLDFNRTNRKILVKR